MGKEILWLWRRIKRGKQWKGKQYHLPHNIGAIGKNNGDEDGNFEEENKDLKYGGGEEYQVVGNFIHPCLVRKGNQGHPVRRGPLGPVTLPRSIIPTQRLIYTQTSPQVLVWWNSNSHLWCTRLRDTHYLGQLGSNPCCKDKLHRALTTILSQLPTLLKYDKFCYSLWIIPRVHNC